MSITVTPHLNFKNQARDALEFYSHVFGGDITIVTYQDAHNVQHDDEANNVMWGQVVSENGFSIMAYDVPASLAWNTGENTFFVSIGGDSVEEITQYWDKLSHDGYVIVPLSPSGWSPLYGMIKDKFGITWTLNVRNTAS